MGVRAGLSCPEKFEPGLETWLLDAAYVPTGGERQELRTRRGTCLAHDPLDVSGDGCRCHDKLFGHVFRSHTLFKQPQDFELPGSTIATRTPYGATSIASASLAASSACFVAQ
jgi:hypothetical protein